MDQHRKNGGQRMVTTCQLLSLALAVGMVGPFIGIRSVTAQGDGNDTSVLRLEPPVLTVGQGAAASVNVTVILRGTKAGATTLKAWDVPTGMAVSFSPDAGNPPFTSRMSVAAGPTVRPGAYAVKVQAAGANPSGVATYVVTVEKSGGY